VLAVTTAGQMQNVCRCDAVEQTNDVIHHRVSFAYFLNTCGKFDHDFPLKVVGYSLHWLTAVPQSPVPASAFTNKSMDCLQLRPAQSIGMNGWKWVGSYNRAHLAYTT